jgi:hypothetical protein
MDTERTATTHACSGMVTETLWYTAFRDHVQSCEACLGDAALSVISLLVCGELVFEPHFCSEGERLLALVGQSLARPRRR